MKETNLVSEDPLHEQVTDPSTPFEKGSVVIDPEDGTPRQLVRAEKGAYTVLNLVTNKEVASPDTESTPHTLAGNIIVTDDPEEIVREYLEHNISSDLEKFGRTHPHVAAGTIAEAEYAIQSFLD